MKRTIAISALILAFALAMPVVAGEDGKCSHEAQVCLNYMAQHLQGRGWAGVDLDEGHDAMTVTQVFPGTPADRAGVKVGDQLVAINGVKIAEENEEKMQALMADMKPGKTFDYTLARKGKERQVSITLDEMPDEAIQRIVGAHMLKGHSTVEIASNE
jgi:predicted metalloprotease with PDZ domain